ncbi:MAG: reverse transcriptase domain-containing protein, partial [Syntrophomonas sp.]
IEAQKLAERHNGFQNFQYQEHQRKKKRLINVVPRCPNTPEYWAKDKKYNPYYVLKHHKQISRAIRLKIEKGTYRPNAPLIYGKKKSNGKIRRLSIYQIPDAAVSNYLYYKLLSKNKHRLSPYAYAYRNDKNVHYAIQDISIDFRQFDRVFVAEYDFSDFFGSISHDFLFEQMDENGFSITQKERALIKTFLPTDGKGIPLGTSISLFLANLVCWRLDKQLELAGIRFARYADDTIIWSEDYSKICRAHSIISDFSNSSGVRINYKKSCGISLLASDDVKSEFSKTKRSIEFLGYEVNNEHVSIKESSCRRIKEKISYILYQNLIQPLALDMINANNISLPNSIYDPALLVAISQVRRYLYGDLSDDKIIKYLNNTYKRLEFKGLMSFYPLVNDETQLQQLDGWLVSVIIKYLKKRYLILEENELPVPNIPLTSRAGFIEYCSRQIINNKTQLLKIPSFIRIYQAIKKGINTQGLSGIINPQNAAYEYESME